VGLLDAKGDRVHPDRTKQSDESALLQLAEEMVGNCRALAGCLAALEEAPADHLEESWLRSLEQVRLLRARISAGADEVLSARARGLLLSPPARDALDARTDEAARLLREGASSYSRLKDKVSLLLGEVGQRLSDVQRGGRVLRSYARATRGVR
jgi:hypothetical protein